MAYHRWTGAGHDIPQITTVTVGGTWASTETAILEINNKRLILTLGTDVATTDVAAELKAAWNAASATDNLVGSNQDESRNFGGQEFPEFKEITASVSGSVVTLTGTAGVPFTVTEDVTGTASGTLTLAEAQAADGKHFFNNADNWEGGVPVNNGTLLFDSGSISVKYALNTGLTDLDLIREDNYTGDIGLPVTNETWGYVEYRQRFIDMDNSGGGSQSVQVGSFATSNTTPAGRTYIDMGTTAGGSITVIIGNAPTTTAADREAVQIVGGDNLQVDVYKGSVSLGAHAKENSTMIGSLEISKFASDSDAYVRCGGYADFEANGETIYIYSGRLDMEYGMANAAHEMYVYGGEVLFASPTTAQDIYVFGGLVDWRGQSGISGNLHVYKSGEFNCEKAPGNFSASNTVQLYESATFTDPHGRYNSGLITLQVNGCSIEDVTLNTKHNMEWTAAAGSAVTPV